MTHPESKHRPIEFSGPVEALATTLGLPVSELREAITGLIERGYLAPIGGGAWRLFPKPAR
jgi:DNA-binding IclR family transcriptional regulator